MSDRLTAEPGSLEFLRQLLEIARESDHPMDKALARVLAKQIGEQEEGTNESPTTTTSPAEVQRERQGSQE
jgi:hypothetical protein